MDHNSLFSGNNAAFLDELYQAYTKDPSSVDSSWATFFADFNHNNGVQPPSANDTLSDVPRGSGQGQKNNHVVVVEDSDQGRLEEAVTRMIHTYRLCGHLDAKLDPLGKKREANPMLKPAHYGLTEADLDREVHAGSLFVQSLVPVREIIRKLQETYCRHASVEYMHMPENEERMWLQAEMEKHENKLSLSKEEKHAILERLTSTDGFEQFLHTKYRGAKRFSLSGTESLIPMIDALLDEAGQGGLKEMVIGMAHRGRLNVLTNTLGKPLPAMFSEFEKNPDPRTLWGSGDVKYHMGYSNDHITQKGHKIHVSLSFNPSHLEAVDPVVLGRVRAKQDFLADKERNQVMALLIHGDAAFAGQGVVAETLNLAGLEGYTTGGTIHIVINNQIGFTTFPKDSRSTYYATDIAHMMTIPIFHVNGDDPEACVYVTRLAQRYRQRFHKSVVIDLIGFRRYGHNESDEPTFTQPGMYKSIQDHPSVRQLYARELEKQGALQAGEAEAIYKRHMDNFQSALESAKSSPVPKVISSLAGRWVGYVGGADQDCEEANTAVPKEVIEQMAQQMSKIPEGFHLHPKLVALVKNRLAMGTGEKPLDWSMGESLAWGTLLLEGKHIRLSGQDVRRGTFSHRHAAFTDTETDVRYVPLANLQKNQGSFEVFDSSLSEAGVLGFDYGYSLDSPDRLVIWEAQFGDFVNNAQVVLDQFISSAEDKWKRLSGVTLFLPHGYEGAGPEHSSAKLERFLQLCAEDNWQIAVPTNPAQMFHLLRRQVVRRYRKPLIIFTPKSLLRDPNAVSSLNELTQGGFQRVIPDTQAEPSEVRRVLLCSGKIYYDLVDARKKRSDTQTAIIRVEQLYPFPGAQIKAELARYTHMNDLCWVQEEPENMGAWTFLAMRLWNLTGQKMMPRVASRDASASPATGSTDTHLLEQTMLVSSAFRNEDTNTSS
jgi:2-oxoglutarate dehydrogenase E1 component